MKLVRMNGKVHVASKHGSLTPGIGLPTAKCNPRKSAYASSASSNALATWDGEPGDVTCEKCKAALRNHDLYYDIFHL